MRTLACLLIVQQATFSVRTEMVVLPVTVTDARGQAVAGLTADHFRIYDDGRLQPIALFRGGDVPLTVGLVVDHSQSMGPKRAGAYSAIGAFARAGREDDEMFVVGFSERAEVKSLPGGKLFTSDPSELAASLDSAMPGGRTALYDAVALGLQHLAAGRSERKALIVVTDGGDNASRMKYGQVRDLARASQAVIYGIGLTGAELQEENPNNLRRLCKDSGGVAHFPPASAVERVMMEIAQDLRTQYTIGFTPAAPRGEETFHKIKVTATSSTGVKLRIRTRAGYSVRAPQ
jgi:Ca-activated chloride channel family protein